MARGSCSSLSYPSAASQHGAPLRQALERRLRLHRQAILGRTLGEGLAVGRDGNRQDLAAELEALAQAEEGTRWQESVWNIGLPGEEQHPSDTYQRSIHRQHGRILGSEWGGATRASFLQRT